MLPSGAIRCWKTRLIALGLASCLAGCQILPPSESISTPSLQLREALGHEVKPIATYGGVGSPSSGGVGALILTQDSLQFRGWKTGRYESKGLNVPYENIELVYSGTLQLVVIERRDGRKAGYRDYRFNFGLLPREAPLSSAEHTLLTLLDRTDTTHLPSPEMWNMRDRVIAVTRGGWILEFETSGAGGISKRAAQGGGIGAAPFYLGAYLGGGSMALPLAIVVGAIGATVGAVVGLGEKLITEQPAASDSEQIRVPRREMMNQSKVVPVQLWLHDSVMALVLKQDATAKGRENGHLFTRVDDLSARGPGIEGDTAYRPLFREAIDHVLEVSVRELRVKTPDSKDKKEVQDIFFELEGGYRVLSVAQGNKLADAEFVCRSTSHPVTAWQVEDAKLFYEELHHCIDQLSEKIVSDFLTRFPDATSLRNQRGSDRIENDSQSITTDPAK